MVNYVNLICVFASDLTACLRSLSFFAYSQDPKCRRIAGIVIVKWLAFLKCHLEWGRGEEEFIVKPKIGNLEYSNTFDKV